MSKRGAVWAGLAWSVLALGARAGMDSLPVWAYNVADAGAGLGACVATAGDVNGDGYSDVVVGAPGYDGGLVDQGLAAVFYGSAIGLSLTPDWSKTGSAAGDILGTGGGAAGDVNGDGYGDVVVGAPRADAGGLADAGTAYVYLGSASGLSATAAWTKQGEQAGEQFGNSVAGAGDVNGDGYGDVIVGAHEYESGLGQTTEGRACVFHGSASGPGQAAAWQWEPDQADARFGYCVRSAGDVNGDGYGDVIAGAPEADNGHANEGLAYVFHGSGSGLGLAPAAILEPNVANARLGFSVAGAGDVNGDGFGDVVVGAPVYPDGLQVKGKVWVFHGSAGGINTTPAVQMLGALNWNLGWSVGAAGDVNGDGYADIMMGAPSVTLLGKTEAGMAFVLPGSAGGIQTTAVWYAFGQADAQWLGQCVAGAGDVNGDGYSDVLVGSPGAGGSGEGQATLYGGCAEMVSSNVRTAEMNQANASLGLMVAGAGDVNGDGYADVAVGAPYYDNGQADEGAMFLFYGSATGAPAAPGWTGECHQAGATYGYAVAGAGDVNGDGYADVAVGAPAYAGGQSGEGKVFVYHGAAAGLAASPAWQAEGNQADARFGAALAGAGDVNGDGFGDLLVGAPQARSTLQYEGAAYLFRGGASGLAATSMWTAVGGEAFCSFGWSVAGAGDVNGDALSDVAVGAPLMAAGGLLRGRVNVYHGALASVPSATPSWTAVGSQDSEQFGFAVAGAGDVNGDLYDDLLVGSPYFTDGQASEGRAHLYAGSGLGLGGSALWVADGQQAGVGFGCSVAGAGDMDNDGFGDVAVGADNYIQVHAGEGAVWVYRGASAGPGSQAAWSAYGGALGAGLGHSVAGAGDVNGDGFSDLVAGAPYQTSGQSGEGQVRVFLGNSGPGQPVRPRQLRVNSGAPIAPLGWSDSEDSFRINLNARSPMGRGPVKLEWQAALISMPFIGWFPFGQAGTSAAWKAAGAGGTSLVETVTGLTNNYPYHWRARVIYPAGNLFGQRGGPWVTGNGRGMSQMHLRTAPDSTRPTVALSTAAANPARVPVLNVTATFSENVYRFSASGIVAGNGTVGNFSGSGQTYTFEVTPAAPGAVTVDVPAGAAVDYYENPNLPAARLSRLVLHGACPNDYNGDGRSDLAVFDSNTGYWYVQTLAASLITWAAPWGWPGALPLPGDYDGDRVCDLAVFDTNTGNWYAREAAIVQAVVWAAAWGWPGAVPVAGDYDGDGIEDFAVFDSNTGAWYIAPNASGAVGSPLAWAAAWGWPGAVPVRGDYDADGRADLAVFDSNTGAWYIRTLSGAPLAWALAWGWPGAIPVPGDYNGDARNDLAVFDSHTGNWYIIGLQGGAFGALLAWAVPWGWPGAVPVPGDYNGDGTFDLALFDTNTGNWYVATLSGGALGSVLGWAVPWGWPGAVPPGGAR